MAKIKEEITVPHGKKEEIAKEVKFSTKTVGKALGFVTNSDIAKNIRYIAMSKYNGSYCTYEL